MSEGENGVAPTNESGEHQQRAIPSPSSMIGARSASPAKRSAADMEDEKQRVEKMPGSFTQEEDTGPTDFDTIMSGMTPASQAGGETQTLASTATSSMATSTDGSVDTSATSVQSDQPSPETVLPAAPKEPHSPERMAQQVAHVHQLANKHTLDAGVRGFVISNKWLARVLSRIPEAEKSGEFPKDAREGPVGPLDNSDILAPGAYDRPVLRDPQGAPFISLKPGLTYGQEFEIVPPDAYYYIVGEYGYKEKNPPVRYVHNTAEEGALQNNLMYETYPPVLTIRKLPQPKDDEEAPKSTSASLDKLRLKKEREGRGQVQGDDAAVLVSSRAERFKKFLTRAKEAAGIPIHTKVKVWKVLDASKVAVDRPENIKPGVLSPPASRAASPSKAANTKLVLDAETFAKLEVGSDIEYVDVKDETNNDKYNGKSNMSVVGLFENCTLILEEQKGGPGGGEFVSDLKKTTKHALIKNGTISKPGSAPASGRSSPVPGVMARGRPILRKDGRARGCAGLSNLGNTCYMNSALQCIRSVEELACYFLDNKHKREINNDNPLGHHGAMANAYAGVLRGIYDQGGNAFSPQDFKRTLGRLQPMFSGYGQQDSQEFLSFLVDALHEDLNRIQKKPYLENPDSDDNKVKDPEYIRELGEVYRTNHRKRNDSIAMDLFSGFYKNTMECPVCDKVSVTFDPYSLLTVQLPMDHAFQHSICFVPLHGKPVIHEIDMDKMSTIKTLKEYVASKHAGVDAKKLWMAEIWSHKLYKVFDDNMTLLEASIQANDHIFIYQLDDVPRNAPTGKKNYNSYGYGKSEDTVPAEGMDSPKADIFAVPILSRVPGKTYGSDAVLFPLYITLTREEAKNYEIILKKVLIAVANTTSRPILHEFADDAAPEKTRNADDETENVGLDDPAGVSDHSALSEEEYVNVSLDKPTTAQPRAGDASPIQVDGSERYVPENFMDPQYFLSPALRHQLFDLRYTPSSDNSLHCTNLAIGGVRSDAAHVLSDRVKILDRRSSVQSSASEESTTTSGSGNHGQEESEESDADDDDADKPDIVLGEQPLSNEMVEDSDDELNGPNTYNAPRGGRGKKNRRGKGKNRRREKQNGLIQYGKKNKPFAQNRSGGGISLGGKQQDDSPYYVQLGEILVLDWRPEAFDSLFEGDEKDSSEMRGHRIVDDTGRYGAIFEDAALQARKLKRAERKKHGVTLEDCFAETGKKERLSEDNAWYCNRCKELRQAYKQLDIWTLPDILVVHMKRFGGGRAMRDKIDILVDYPTEGLDMSDKVGLKEGDKEYIYDLFAVDCHYGGLGGGHYTAMAKNFFDGKWYNYNDSSCSGIRSDNELVVPAAYLLFYRRRSATPLGPPELQKIVTDYRNPQEAEDGEESESGEGLLGGPVHSSQHQHGSSSALVGAGVGAMTSQMDPHAANGGLGADSSLTTRQTMTSNDFNDAGWSFNNLDDDPSANLLAGVGEDDADSNKAEMDNDSAIGDTGSLGSTGVNKSPNLDHTMADFGEEDLYEQGLGDVQHFEHAPPAYEEEDPAVHDIHVGGHGPGNVNGEMESAASRYFASCDD